ncbi:MAG TPA: hypothetical protein VEG08_10015 [Terriglobales bacterium]|nr:hypothetical protein [Terriglobales bacterium]
MKFSFLPVVLLLAAGVWAQEAKPAAAPAAPAQAQTQVIAQASDRPDSGRVAQDVYTSDFFGFTLSLPKGWEVEDSAALRKSVDENLQKLYGSDPQSQAAGQEAAARAFLLLSAAGRVEMEAVPSQVQVAAERLPEDAGVESGKDYLEAVGSVPPLAGLDLKPLHPPAEVRLGGQPFWRQDYSAATIINGKSVSISYAEYVSIQKDYALILSFWTDTPEHLAALEKYADSVKFAAPAEPPK